MSWTNEEVQNLKDYYPTKPSSWLEEYFDRSWSAIRKKSNRIGVNRHSQIHLIESVRNAPEPHFPDESFNNYIVGFVDGEGTFVSPDTNRENQERFRFAIELADGDAEILEKMKEYFGVGNIHYMDKRQDGWSNHVTYYVTNYGELVSVIIPFFDEYSPRAPQKKSQYQWWRESVIEYTQFNTERFK